MLGEAFYAQFKEEYDIKCTDKDVNEDWLSFLDFREREAYIKDVEDFNPDYLFHLGAYTDLEFCEENKDAIVRGLDAVIEGLIDMREVVSTSDRKGLLHRLEQARRARMNLPSKAGAVEDLSEIRIPIPDRPGAAAEVFALSGELGVNIYDFEVVHSAEGDRGVMVAVIRMEHGDIFRGGLLARGFRPALAPLS